MAKYKFRQRQTTDPVPEPSGETARPASAMDNKQPRAQGSRSKPKSSATDWLRKPTTASRTAHKLFLENARGDGILALSQAIRERGDSTQEYMLSKLYLFMRDCLPDGLAGSHAHIKGDEIMRHLLCCTTETAPSRHKATKQAEAAFTRLEAWMAAGRNWKEAQRASIEADRDMEKRSNSRKKQKGLAPGLHSPAGILALLVIAHPEDAKFKNWIVGRLQVDWMLADRETLRVRHGFWKGVTAENLQDVFAPEEPRDAELPLLADYTRLFGEFTRAKRDIRPYLQAWAQDLDSFKDPLTRDTADNPRTPRTIVATPLRSASESARPAGDSSQVVIGLSSDSDSSADEAMSDEASQLPDQEVHALRHCLCPSLPVPPAYLEQWLSEKLRATAGPSDTLKKWCRYWEKKMDSVQNYQDQLITRSLFIQSAQRLQSISQSPVSSFDSFTDVSLEELYMVVDIYDGKRSAPLEDSLFKQTLEFLQALPAYQPLADSNSSFAESVRDVTGTQDVPGLVQKRLDAQTTALYHISKSSAFSDHLLSAMTFYALRTRALLQQGEARADEDVQFWHKTRDVLLSDDMAATLQLTEWQSQSLLLPGNCSITLTNWQDLVFRTKACPGTQWKDMDITDLAAFMPTRVTARQDSDMAGDSDLAETLGKLFGEIGKPPGMTHTPAVQTPSASPRSSPVLNSSPVPGSTTASSTAPAPVAQAEVQAAASKPAALAATPAPATPGLRSWQPSPRRLSGSTAVSGSSSSVIPGKAPEMTTQNTPQPQSITSTPANPIEKPVVPSHLNVGRNEFALARSPSATSIQRNSFGQAPSPAKRPGSPLVPTHAKMPRVGFKGDLDDLEERLNRELNAHKETLRADITAEREHLRQSIQKEISASEERSRAHMEALKADLRLVRSEICTRQDDIQAKSDAARVESRQHLEDEFREVRDRLDRLRASLDTKSENVLAEISQFNTGKDQNMKVTTEALREVREKLDTLETGLDVKLQGALTETSELKSMLASAPPPAAGQLVRTCPAPEGQDQKAYESSLFRACLSYVFVFWDPLYNIDGVNQDYSALEETKRRFPDLEEDAIVSALRYFHEVVFNRPLGDGQPHLEEGPDVPEPLFQE